MRLQGEVKRDGDREFVEEGQRNLHTSPRGRSLINAAFLGLMPNNTLHNIHSSYLHRRTPFEGWVIDIKPPRNPYS